MVIKVSLELLKTPTLNEQGSPYPRKMYYKVDCVPELWKVVNHLKSTVKYLDPSTVRVEETDLDAEELRRKGKTVHGDVF